MGPFKTRDAILAIGSRIDTQVKLEAGQTILGEVESESFYPSLSLIDSDGKEIAKQVDQEEGSQKAWMKTVAPKAGTYSLRVSTTQASGGGKFQLRHLTFQSQEIKVGSNTIQVEAPKQNRFHLRVDLKAGKLYDLSNAQLRYKEGRMDMTHTMQPSTIDGPTGDDSRDFSMLGQLNGSLILQARKGGTYYLTFNFSKQAEMSLVVQEITPVQLGSDGKTEHPSAKQEAIIIETPVKKGQMIRSVTAGPTLQFVSFEPSDPELDTVSVANLYAAVNSSGWSTDLPATVNDPSDVLRVIQVDGTMRYGLRANSPVGEISLTNSSKIPEWQPGSKLQETLSIGRAKFFTYQSSATELSRVRAEADAFQPRIDIVSKDGAVLNTLTSMRKTSTLDDLYFPLADQFLIRVSCQGDGGAGKIALTRQPLESTSYLLGKSVTTGLDNTTYGLYSVNLVEGQRYELLVGAPAFRISPDLVDPSGQFLPSQLLAFEEVTVFYFVAVRSGLHRLWLRGNGDKVTFSMQKHTPPKIGG